MAYDVALAERVQWYFQGRPEVTTRKMFGGLCFMLSGHMCCGIVGDRLMARVGPDRYEQSLLNNHVSEMDFTGKPMKGMVFVLPEGIEKDRDLGNWLKRCELFVESLPPK